jgi:hypothetical protein
MSYLEPPQWEPCVKIDGARVGHFLGLDVDGAPLVDFEGNLWGPITARLAVPGLAEPDGLAPDKVRVVLVFEDADPSRPIIVGFLPVKSSDGETSIPERVPVLEPIALVIDGQTLRIEARDEVTLCCGEASLTLRKDGKILLRGTDITSHATRVNKVKGGAVRIN